VSGSRFRGRVAVRAVLAVLLLGATASTAALTAAQTPARGRAPARPSRPRAPGRGDAGPIPESTRPSGDAGVVQAAPQRLRDGGSKVFRFGELEIEGRLKNPQLVFFLRRVRAEFAAGDLGHRSFLRELGETKLDPNF